MTTADKTSTPSDASTSPASVGSAPGSAASNTQRRAAIDWMRGFVMVLMTLDHASQMWNAKRIANDSAYLVTMATGGLAWTPGDVLDPAQFYTRWVTHLCAPTFLFLSGTSLAMSLEKRRAEGMSDAELDRHLFIRAAVIMGFEGLLSLLGGEGIFILQVLFAISASMLAMIVLRRLPTTVLIAIGAAWLLGSEWVLGHLAPIEAGDAARSLWQIVFLIPGYAAPFYSMYPMTHWLAMMLLGWAFGRYLLELPETDFGGQQAEKLLLLAGLSALLFWAYLRGGNAYGNLGVPRYENTVVEWLHMSKYPPALVYSLMELGLMALCLLVFMRFERRMTSPPRQSNPLLVFGQTALFYYMIHFIGLGAAAIAITGGMMQRGLTETYLAAAATLVLLYPVCIGFRSLKRKYPKSLLQYI